MTNQRRPMSPQESIQKMLGCLHSNPNISQKNATPGKCAFVRDGGVCLTPPMSGKLIYKELGGK